MTEFSWRPEKELFQFNKVISGPLPRACSSWLCMAAVYSFVINIKKNQLNFGADNTDQELN